MTHFWMRNSRSVHDTMHVHESNIRSVQGAIYLAFVSLTMGAAVPQLRTPGPGYFRMMLGDFEVTALHDGDIVLHADDYLPSIETDEIKRVYQRDFIPTPYVAPVNAFLINTNENLVLIDTGAGESWGNSCGLLLKNLRASGYQPEQVDLILLTHLHSDHPGGLLTPEGSIAFPNATVRVSQAEAEYWLEPKNKATTFEVMADSFDRASNVASKYQAAGKFKPFNSTESESLVKGICAITRFGHTPGHTVYFVESGGHTLVVWGDIMHDEPLQMRYPSVIQKYDHSQEEGRNARVELLEMIRDKKYLAAGAHIPFPGIGHVRAGANAAAFEWVPVRYEADLQRNKTGDFSIAG